MSVAELSQSSEENSPKVALLGRIDDEVLVDAEEVAASDTLTLVRLLSPIRDLLPDQLSDVLDHHLASGNESVKVVERSANAHRNKSEEHALHRKESVALDSRPRKGELLLASPKLVELEDVRVGRGDLLVQLHPAYESARIR